MSPAGRPRKRLTIIVAALNEERNLEAAISAITRAFDATGWEYEILLFDDHSTDGTGALADRLAAANPHLRVFHNEHGLNIGGIYKAGIREAAHDYCLLLPGDNEVLVEEVARGVAYLDRADLVVTYIANQNIRPVLRQVLSRAYTALVNVLFGLEFAYTNGSNICRTDRLRAITINTSGFSYQTEALVKLVRQGVDFVEFGINIRPREHGHSTALAPGNWAKVIRAVTSLWWDVRVRNRRLYRTVGRKLPLPCDGLSATTQPGRCPE